MWIEVDPRSVLADREAFDAVWRAETLDGREASFSHDGSALSAEGDVRFILRHGVEREEQAVGDFRVALELEVRGAAGEFFAEIRNGQGAFEVRLPSGGEGRLVWRPAGHGEARAVPLRGGTFAPGRRLRLDLSVFDGQAVARLDAKVLGEIPFMTFLEEARADPEKTQQVSFGTRGLGLRVTELKAGHDIHYLGRSTMGEGEPVAIPAGGYFVLGDNPRASHDSRGWTRRVFHLKDGRRVECEAQEVIPSDGPEQGLMIRADVDGKEVEFLTRDIEREEEEPFRFVGREYVTGKVVKIWWPPARARGVR